MNVEETLRSTLEERAAALPTGRPDVSALLAAGEASRRGRRNRRMVVLAAAAAVVLVLVGVSRLGDPERDVRPAGLPDRGDRTGTPGDATVLDVGGAPGKSIAIDPAAGLLYVGTSPEAPAGTQFGGLEEKDGQVAVVDTTSGVLVDTIDLGAPYVAGGLALDTPRDLLYVALGDGENPTVAVVSTATGQVVDTIDVGPDTPEEVSMGDLVFDPETRTLFATTTVLPARGSDQDGSLAIVDTDSRTLVERIPVSVSAGARGVALDEDRHAVYVSGREDQLLMVDTRTRRVVDTIDGVGPSGCLSFDPVSDLLFNCNETAKTITVVDAGTHEVLTKLRDGGQEPLAVAIDHQAGRAYSYNKLIDLETLEIVDTLRPRLPDNWYVEPLVVDQSTHTIYAWGFKPVQVGEYSYPDLIALTPPKT